MILHNHIYALLQCFGVDGAGSTRGNVSVRVDEVCHRQRVSAVCYSRVGFCIVEYGKCVTMFGDKTGKCSDQNNPDLYEKPMAGKALIMPQTIGSTTGGLVLYCAACMSRQPACLLFSKEIDSLAAAGAILADVWTDNSMPTVDGLGDEFLSYVRTGDKITVCEDGSVKVER